LVCRAREIWEKNYKGPTSNKIMDTTSSQSKTSNILVRGLQKRQRTDSDSDLDELERQVLLSNLPF